MAFQVYVLQSQVTGRFYVGSCGDVEERLRRHNAGDTKSTRHGIPWVVVHAESHPTRSAAVRQERYYKTGRGREDLWRLLGRSG